MHLTTFALHIPCKSCCDEFTLFSHLVAQLLPMQASSRACDLSVKSSSSYHSNVCKLCIAKSVSTIPSTLKGVIPA